MTPHPNASELDALAAGDDAAETAAHVASCGECSGYVARLQTASAAFKGRAIGPSEFVEGVEARAKRAGARVFGLRRPFRTVLAVVPALAAAAVLVLLLRARPGQPPSNVPQSSSVAEPRPVEGVRFKGQLPVAVVRERGGRQERFTGKVRVRPMDGLRLELSLDSERLLTAGLLAEDGSWLELMGPRVLGVGTHFSDQSARFDAHPTRGWLLAGEPAAVDKARKTRVFDDVAVLLVELDR